MENARQQNSIESLHGASLLSSVLSVMVAAMACCGGALSRSWSGNIADEFAWCVPRGAGGPRHDGGFFGCAREHAVRSARHIAADVDGVVCDGTFMFRFRCTGGVVCRQWSE